MLVTTWRAQRGEQEKGRPRRLTSDPVDALWFAAHPEDTHRICPPTEEEAAVFRVVRLGFPRLLTVVRRSDGASTTIAVPAGDDIDRAMDCELAGWFDADLDAAADLLP